MTDKLKPCPFCGSEAHLAGGPMAQEQYSVWCVGPAKHNMDYGFNRETAIAAWNTRADLEATASPPIATPMRCAECDCEKGGADCNWIATPTPLDDPRVKALVEAVRHEREMVCQDFDMQLAAARAVDAALSAIKENK